MHPGATVIVDGTSATRYASRLPHEDPMNKNQSIVAFAATFAAGMGLMYLIDHNDSNAGIGPDQAASAAGSASLAGAPKNSGAVKVEFYVMSQCPYGVQAVNGVKEALDKLGPDVDFTMDFIGQTDASGNLSSMHGEAEVKGDIAQLCAAKYAPGKYMDMIACQNKNPREVATNWESCARSAGLPVDSIKTCVNGQEGKDLLKASFARSEAKGATGSPTIYVAGKEYEGRRSPNDFLRAICNAHQGPTKPAACSSIPEQATVNVWLISDKRCTDCETDRLAGAIRSRIAKPNLKELDYGDAEGKKLYEEVGGGNLPILLFDSTLDGDSEAKEMVAEGLQPAGKYRKLSMDGSWNPRCADDGGCKLPECTNTFACRKETPNTLEVFVMSQCPYGVMALNSMKEVLANFKNKIDFRVHFIAQGSASSGFQSLHGPAEVDENIRELCAIKVYSTGYKFMDYILCRNKNIRDTNWESCATGSISSAAIKKCVDSEGKKLLETDIAIGNALGIGASPTWLVNGKYKFQGVDAETIRKNFCEHNAGVAGCNATLSGPSGQLPAGGGCGK